MTLYIAFWNTWAVLVGIVASMIIGALWYSPVLFGNTWLKLIGKTKDEISQSEGNSAMLVSILPTGLSVIFLALILAFVNATTILDALIIGTLLSAGVIGMSAWTLVIFEDRPPKLALLNVGYSFVSLNVAAVILTIWK